MAAWQSTSVRHSLFTIGLSIGLASAALAMYHRLLFRRLLHLILFCILLELFYRFAYGGPVSYGLLLSVPETSGRETLELLAGHAILTWSLSFLALLAVFAMIVSWSTKIRFSMRRCIQGGIVALSMIVASLALGTFHLGEMRPVKLVVPSEVKATFPFDIAAALGSVAVDWADTRLQASARAAFRFPNAHMVDAATRRTASEVYVIIVGETSRRANWSLYGYARATTPYLETMGNDLIPFDRVTSNATNTILSLPLALTRATPATPGIARSQKSIVALLKEAGFDTFWVSNQERSILTSNPISEIAFDADHVSFTSDLKASARDGGLDSNLLAR
ncbi:MAG: sulfatase-like hydrolase/transferase, partial [Gammaproteobacteria bacterium]